MTKLLQGLLCCLLLWSQASAQPAQSKARTANFSGDALAAAFRVARKMESGLNREGNIIRLVQAYAQAGQYEDAFRAASLLDDGGMKALTLGRLSNRLAEAGKLDRSAEVLSGSLQMIKRADSLYLADNALREMVGEEEVLSFDILARLEKRKGALARLIEAGRVSDASKLLDAARAVALDPDFDTDAAPAVLTGIARRYSETGETEKATEVLSDALKAARLMEDEYDRAIDLTTVAGGYARAGDKKEASKLIEEAFRIASALDNNRDRALMAVARAYAETGLHEQSLKAAREMSDEGRWSAFTFLNGNKSAPQVEEFREFLSQAVEAASALEYDNNKATALIGIVRSTDADSSDILLKAQTALRAINEGAYRAEALVAVGDKYAELKQKEKALEAWQQAFNSARELSLTRTDYHPGDSRINNDRERVRLLKTLAQRFINAGQPERITEIAQSLEANYVRALSVAAGSPAQVSETGEALARLSDELIRAGRKDEALEVLAAASRIAAKKSKNLSEHSRAGTMAVIGSVYAKAGDEGEASLYFNRALQITSGVEDYDGVNKTFLLTQIGSMYAEAGLKPDARARKTLRRIVRDIEEELD